MNLVFMGTPYFAVPSLQKLAESRHQVRGVVTQPDKPRGRGQALMAPPVKVYSQENGIPVLQPENLREEGFIESLQRIGPDLIAVVAFRILPHEVFSIPPKGAVNLHASLLPAYRGAAPIQWAVINGEKKTGLTTFFIQEQVDTGNILMQKEIDILAGETSGALAERMKYQGADLLLETINRIEDKNIKAKPQKQGDVSRAPKLSKEDGLVNWQEEAESIFNRVRGLNPAPGAYTFLNGTQLKIHKAAPVRANGSASRPGEVVEARDHLVVGCGKDNLELIEVQLAGKRPMAAVDFLRGMRLGSGVKLGK